MGGGCKPGYCCVILASKNACHPDDDIVVPKPGMLWIKDTGVMYVYQNCKWQQVPIAQDVFFQFNDAVTEETATNISNATIVKTFVFPYNYINGLTKTGSQIRRFEYSHSWDQPIVGDPIINQGMTVVLRDKLSKDPIVITQNIPTQYETFAVTEDILYQPNPGDILEILIRKPEDYPPGRGVLNSVKLYISPFDPDY